MASDTPQWDDDTSEQRAWAILLRATWTTVILLAAAGTLAVLSHAFGWNPSLLLSVLGLLAGLALLAAFLGAERGRQLAGVVLGAVTLPLLAVWLSGLAAGSPDRFTAYGAAFATFLGHAVAVVTGGVLIARVWRVRPPAAAPAGATSTITHEGGAP